MAKPAVSTSAPSAGRRARAGSGSAPVATPSGRSSRSCTDERRPQASARAGSPSRSARSRSVEAERISSGVPELDRVLGGGIVPASLVLVGGEPGVGKSTLLLSALGAIARTGRRALLVTGEESARAGLAAGSPAGRRGRRVEILAETELDTVCATLEAERPDVCVIDSVQTLHASALGSAPGSVAQVREAAGRLLRVAKEAGVATILVGHVTKDGAVAGPRVLEHLVDCVLQFEGDRYHAHRVLRATKNRFGSTNEVGVFEMTAAGPRRRAGPVGALRVDASGRDRGRRGLRPRGNAAAAARDPGARGADRPRDAEARRHGCRPARLAMLVAVLGRHAGVALGERRRVRQRRGRGEDRGAGRRSRDRPRDRLRGTRRPAARGCSPRSARSASRAGCARRRRPNGDSTSARSSVSRRWSPRQGPPMRDRPRVAAAETLRAALRAGLRGVRRGARSGRRVDSQRRRGAVAVPLRACEKPAIIRPVAGRETTAGTFS